MTTEALKKSARTSLGSTSAEKDDLGPCELWQGGFNSGGYGQAWVPQKGHPKHGYKKTATRVVWEKANGPIPRGLVVRHRCDNPPCVRLSHLVLGTLRDNTRDMVERGRARWQGRPRTYDDNFRAAVEELLAQGLSGTEIAARMGCGTSFVSYIRSGRTRKHG